MDLKPRKQAQNHFDWGSELATLDTLRSIIFAHIHATLDSIRYTSLVVPGCSVHANEPCPFHFRILSEQQSKLL